MSEVEEEWNERSNSAWDQYEGPEPHYSSLFFSAWVSFVFLWRTWIRLEMHHGMNTEYTRRVSSLDLVAGHLGITTFFIPMRFLYFAPESLYWGIMITMFVVYSVGFIVFIVVIKLSSSKANMAIGVLIYFSYLFVYYGAGTLGQIVVKSSFPHSVWMFLNLLCMVLISLRERYRVSGSDPLDYNYTHDQKRQLRNFENKGGIGGAMNAMRRVTQPSVEFGGGAKRIEEGRIAAAAGSGGGSNKYSLSGGGRPKSARVPSPQRPKSMTKKYGGGVY